MKTIKFSATEKHTDYLLQVIGTDDLDNYMRTLIERDMEQSNHDNQKNTKQRYWTSHLHS